MNRSLGWFRSREHPAGLRVTPASEALLELGRIVPASAPRDEIEWAAAGGRAQVT